MSRCEARLMGILSVQRSLALLDEADNWMGDNLKVPPVVLLGESGWHGYHKSDLPCLRSLPKVRVSVNFSLTRGFFPGTPFSSPIINGLVSVCGVEGQTFINLICVCFLRCPLFGNKFNACAMNSIERNLKMKKHEFALK